MLHPRLRQLALSCFALILTLALSLSPTPAPAQSGRPVANVYVETSNGVNVYNTASSGRLTLVAGSPFKITGQMIGAMGNHLVSLGEDNIHVYGLASNGAVEGQVGEASTQDFDGKQCGTVSFAAFDRTGQDLYVGVSGTENQDLATQCIAIQSFKISSAGTPSYIGTIIPYNDPSGTMNVYYYQLVMSGGNQYAYAIVAGLSGTCDEPEIVAFQRESSGALELAGTQSIQYPEPAPGDWQYFPYSISADSGNHLAVNLEPEQNAPCGTKGSPQLSSFSVNSNGSITSTNFYQNMPTITSSTGFEMGPLSPSGIVLPVAIGNNLQLFHFNGSSPITSMTGQIPVKGLMSFLQWDTSSHLYGLNINTHILRVYTVTSTGLAEDPGSPVAITGAQSLFVVSLTPASSACSAPTSGVNVCSPAEGATVTSPVSINAAANISGGVYRFSLWNGDTKLLNEDSGVMNGSISLPAGTYHLIFDANNTAGNHVNATRDITVK